MCERLYILVGRTPRRVCNFARWTRWRLHGDRRVRRTIIGPLTVSTVFLGLDHNDSPGPPLLFECKVFGLGKDSYQTLCSTWDEAERAHEAACEFARGLVADAVRVLADIWTGQSQ
jgi:hypothetical protein